MAWTYETSAVYGPRIDSKKARSTVSRSKPEATHDVTADYCQLNNNQVAVGITACEQNDSESHVLNFPCSVTSCLSSRTVSEDPVEKPRTPAVFQLFNSHKETPTFTGERQTEVTNNNLVSKHCSEDVVFVSTKRERTYGYTWVNSPAQQLPADKEENTVASFTQTSNIDSDNLQNVEHVNHTGTVTNTSSDSREMSTADRERSVDNSSASELQTDEGGAQKNSSDHDILSFPLFSTHVMPSEAASLSVRLHSVSAILKATMPPENQLALTRWEQRMIAELGEDGFKEYQKGC